VSTTYHGSLTVAGALSGISPVFAQLVNALTNASATITVQVSALNTAKDALRVLAVTDLEAQLDAAIAAIASFQASIGDPAAYIDQLLTGVLQVEANLGVMIPSIALDAQISASLAIQANLEAKIAAFDLALEALVVIANALLAIVAAALPVLSLSAAITSHLGATGAYTYTYDGAITGMGASIEAEVLATTGLPGASVIKSPLVVVYSGNVSGTAAVQAIYNTTP
jgi:hypothetical protein